MEEGSAPSLLFLERQQHGDVNGTQTQQNSTHQHNNSSAHENSKSHEPTTPSSSALHNNKHEIISSNTCTDLTDDSVAERRFSDNLNPRMYVHGADHELASTQIRYGTLISVVVP